MTEKLKLDLPLVLPDVADERDACVGRLIRLLQAEDLELAHLVHEDGGTRLCLHYDPQRFSVNRVRDLVQAAGAKIGDRFRHENLRIDGMDCPTCATVIEHVLQRTDGVLEASVRYAAERLRLEFDSEKVRRSAIVWRRWFFCHDLDLVVWFDDKDHPVAFQLAYDRYRDERWITWDEGKGCCHYAVDEGNPFAGETQTPLLFADGAFDANRIIDLFKSLPTEMPPDIATFVLRKLSDCR